MAPTKESALYVRNARPNRLVIPPDATAGLKRLVLERRGSREDSTSLLLDAKNNPTIARWLNEGVLEQITRDQFMKLAARQIDIEPAQYLKRPVRNGRTADILMHPAEADTTRSPSSIREVDVRKSAVPKLEWNGELMTTAEELEELDYSAPEQNYPSKHRGDEEPRRRQMGY